MKAPALFVGHGSPMNAILDNSISKAWRDLGRTLPRPKAILLCSAHWMTDTTAVRTAKDNRQIYDMYGFPEALYHLKYAPPNDVATAQAALNYLDGVAIENNDWGLDHGAWSVLCHMYPNADVPVVCLSTDITATPEALFEIGRKLRPLREDNVMILGSGNIVHNLRAMDPSLQGGFSWAKAFNQAVKSHIAGRDIQGLFNYSTLSGSGGAVPTVEHFYPLFITLGAAYEVEAPVFFNDCFEMGSLSMTSLLFQ
ncbi:4,5-DOPA dioxygenase extradiol [Peptoniphilus equinus]|uniref:4,5-DOPA dioxygenase extradiol n=1 Tax=Peptoniphilus equinus TaxID=3016343 RepID=A0ABY7QWC9_9FIRM|nr:4,5-DOPA dioxygenase extradiol [Peptoniphilus equinus]WBW50399.1 4,5-DOPA dioxygenase extradiol [Peptoniphilus equinus]